MSSNRSLAGRCLWLLAALLLVGCGGGGGSAAIGGVSGSNPFANLPPVPVISIAKKISGFSVGPFVLAGQDPNQGGSAPSDQLLFLIADAAQYSTWIRTFGTSGTLQLAGQYIHQSGAKAMIGAFLAAPSTSAAISANQQELDRLVTIANAGQADIVTVGNESLFSGALTESQLLGYIVYVKARVPASVQVATVDTWNVLVQHPAVIAAEDVVLANIYPFYENSSASNAVITLQADYAKIKQAVGTKTLMITETGWPSSGAPPSQAPAATPSLANQISYFVAAEQWARQNNIVLIWFEAFNEPWKANYGDYSSWGLFDASFLIESIFQAAFQ